MGARQPLLHVRKGDPCSSSPTLIVWEETSTG